MKPVDAPLSWRAGAEAAIGPSFALRAGYETAPAGRSGVTLGLGFSSDLSSPGASSRRWGAFNVDYAYSLKDDLGAVQQVSLGVEF